MAISWKQLTTLAQLEEIKTDSFKKPVLIFKHSTRCSISHMMIERFQNDYDIEVENLETYHLDLIANREISNKIAETFSVFHQSPQVIIIKDGKSIMDTSHMMIGVDKVKIALTTT